MLAKRYVEHKISEYKSIPMNIVEYDILENNNVTLI